MKLNMINKMLLFILLPALLGLGVVATMSYRGAEDAIVQQIATDMNLLAGSQATGIVGLVDVLEGVLEDNSQIPVFSQLLSAGPDADTAPMLAESQGRVVRINASFPEFSSVGLLGMDGACLAESDSKLLGADFSKRAFFVNAMKGKLAVENYGDKKSGVATYVGVPVQMNGKPVGVLFGVMNLSVMAAMTVDNVKVGQKGVGFVYDKDGLMLMHPDREAIGNQDGDQEWVKTILQQRNGRLPYTLQGVDKRAYFRELPGLNWIAVISVDLDEVLAPVQELLRNMLIVCGITALVVGLIIFVVAKGLATVLSNGVGFAQHIAGGNLILTPEQEVALGQASARGDELGALAQSLASMLNKIRELFDESARKTTEAESATEEARLAVADAEQARRQAEGAKRDGMLAAAGQLEGVAAAVSSASTQLSVQIEQADKGALEAAQRLGQVATAMNEMNATVQEVAQNAASASSASGRTREKAEDGARIVEKSLHSIKEVATVSEELKADMTNLNSHAQAITRIMNVISDIADQTNLLALNAAIEAARAGEAGRGFAVVADEVRKLAEKTMASTNDVGSAIKAIQESTDKSMASVDNAVRRIGETMDLANESGAALEEIVGTVEGAADQVRAIATASEEQSAASEEINHALVEINDRAKGTAEAMAESASAVSDLARQAQALNALIDEMKRG